MDADGDVELEGPAELPDGEETQTPRRAVIREAHTPASGERQEQIHRMSPGYDRSGPQHGQCILNQHFQKAASK